MKAPTRSSPGHDAGAVTDEDLSDLIALAEATGPDADAAAAILADRLTAFGDLRGELIVLDALDRAGRLDQPGQLERLLILAAEYTFPRREPEPPPLRWERANTGAVINYRVVSDAMVVTLDFHERSPHFVVESGPGLPLHADDDVDDCGGFISREKAAPALEGWLPCLDNWKVWTEESAAQCLPTLADWVRHRVPVCALWLPIETIDDDPAPRYEAGPLRIAHLPPRYRQSRGVPYGRFGLAGRDYHRWVSTFRRLEAMLPR